MRYSFFHIFYVAIYYYFVWWSQSNIVSTSPRAVLCGNVGLHTLALLNDLIAVS